MKSRLVNIQKKPSYYRNICNMREFLYLIVRISVFTLFLIFIVEPLKSESIFARIFCFCYDKKHRNIRNIPSIFGVSGAKKGRSTFSVVLRSFLILLSFFRKGLRQRQRQMQRQLCISLLRFVRRKPV